MPFSPTTNTLQAKTYQIKACGKVQRAFPGGELQEKAVTAASHPLMLELGNANTAKMPQSSHGHVLHGSSQHSWATRNSNV